MPNPEIECIRCHHQCNWDDLEVDCGIAICPKCGASDSFVETDSVGPDEPVNE